MTVDDDRQQGDLRDEPIAELVKRLAAETNTLVRQEIELAKAELTEKARTAGKGAGMFGGAGALGLLGAGALTACLIALLATAIDHVWLAALIIALVYAAIAAVLAMRGRAAMQAAGPPAPERAIENAKEDVEWAKTRTRSAMR
jgi:predicted lipid-binding transport protein (Tim44 family)